MHLLQSIFLQETVRKNLQISAFPLLQVNFESWLQKRKELPPNFVTSLILCIVLQHNIAQDTWKDTLIIAETKSQEKCNLHKFEIFHWKEILGE